MTEQNAESVPDDDLTPEEEAWCVEFFRGLFPDEDAQIDGSGVSGEGQ